MMKNQKKLISTLGLSLAFASSAVMAEIDVQPLDDVRHNISAPLLSKEITDIQEKLQQETLTASPSNGTPATETAEGSNAWYNSARSTVKAISGFTGVALLTDSLTNKGLLMVEGAVMAATGNKWLATAAKVGAFDTVYNFSRDTAFVVGFKTPDIIEKAVGVYNNPKAALETATEILKTGAQVVTTQVGSYLLTQPATELAGNVAYYAAFAVTGSPLMGYAAYTATKGAVHYTGLGNLVAKTVGYQAPEVAGQAVKTIGNKVSSLKNWWYGSNNAETMPQA